MYRTEIYEYYVDARPLQIKFHCSSETKPFRPANGFYVSAPYIAIQLHNTKKIKLF